MDQFIVLLPAAAAFLCLSLALFAFSRNPWQISNLGFALGMLSLFLMEAGDSALLLLGDRRALAYLGLKVSFAGQAFIPFSWLIFTAVFARDGQKDMLKRFLPVISLMGVAAVFFSLLPGRLIFSLPAKTAFGPGGGTIFTIGAGGKFFYAYLIAGLFINLIQLESTLRSSKDPEGRRIRHMVLAAGGLFAFLIYGSVHALASSSLSFDAVALTSSVVLATSLMMAAFIIRNRLLDSDIRISRHALYCSFGFLAAGVYLAATGAVAYGIRRSDMPFNYFFSTLFIFSSLFLLVVFLVNVRLRRKAKLLIGRRFHRHKHEFRERWMETLERISSKMTVGEAVSTLKDMVLSDMCARHALLWLYDPASRSYRAMDKAALKDSVAEIHPSHPVIRCLKDQASPFLSRSSAFGSYGSDPLLKALFSETGTVLCAPIATGKDLAGFIMVGPDLSGESYVKEDLDLLRALCSHTAVQIRNIRLSEELMEAKEAEAFNRMSSFIMHDFKNLTNSLSLMSQNARSNIGNPEFQKDAIKTIDATVKRMQSLIDLLSSAPRRIELRKEETDLRNLIERLLVTTPLPQNKEIALIRDLDDVPHVSVDPMAMESVITNIILNSCDAIDRMGMIRVRTSVNGPDLDINISDNGHGMSKEHMDTMLFKPFRTTKRNGFGVGLYQSKIIVEAHGGTMRVESQTGKGTSFTIRLPAVLS